LHLRFSRGPGTTAVPKGLSKTALRGRIKLPTMTPVICDNKSSTEGISGLIERVTFHNDESGFCVLRVKAPGHRDEVTVVGSLPSVTAGEWLVTEGWWVRDKEHGLQFKANTMTTVPPTTAEGIERYLSSGLVKGIGPVLAKKLVGRFGEEVLAVIEKRAAELESVDGIGPKAHPTAARLPLMRSAYCGGRHESIVWNAFPFQIFPLRMPTPPPPSEAVTLQPSVGGAMSTPIGVSEFNTACAQTKPVNAVELQL